jgi:hypothetical protein
MEEPPKSTNHPDKSPLRQHLVDRPDPELRPIRHFIREQHHTFRRAGVMNQGSIVLYLNRKGRTAQVIHDDLVATLGAEANAYSTVTSYLRAARIIRRDATPLSPSNSPHIDESDEAALRELEELPFSSVRQLAHAAHLPVTTVYRR